jgi:hypothetical protein
VHVTLRAALVRAACVLLLGSGWTAAGCVDCGAPVSADSTIGTDSAPSATDAVATDAAPDPCTCYSMCPVDDTVTGPVTFSDVEPIFTFNCSNGPCHVDPGGSMGAGEVLTATDLCNSTVNVVATETASSSMMNRITPGDPEASYLFHKLRGTHRLAPALGTGCRMPYGSCCLSPQDIGKIREWITEGATCL